MGVLSDYLDDHPAVRNPPYRPLATIDEAERQRLEERIGGPEHYASDVLQRLVLDDPDDPEYKRALVSAIVSAEYAGIDAFGRNVARWEDQPIPDGLLLAMVRQTWDEVRHARLGTELLEAYGGTLGDYPDTLAGASQAQQQTQDEQMAARVRALNPVMVLSSVNVGIEGAALRLFSGVSRLGERVGDRLMQHAYDYNWADEVVHVSIGDWFLKKIAEARPQSETLALRAQAMTEAGREHQRRYVAPEVREEVRDFLQGETDRATSVLVGPLSDAPPGGAMSARERQALTGGYEPGA
jgi:uncharacterized ferritin-like protein (DUF455 family)